MPGMPDRDLSATRAQAQQQRLFSQTSELPISDLLPSPENGRKKLRNVKGLADSFEDDGVVQALTVVTAATYIAKYPKHREYVERSGKPYVVLHGHRRLAAAQQRGIDKVPVFVRKKVDGSVRIAGLKENEQRLQLDPIEQGVEYQLAMDEENISQRELARRLGGTSQTAISHKIKLQRLIEPLQNAVTDHWCKQNGLELEYGGELLLPIKEAATVLAGLREDLQQAFVDGGLLLADAEAIVKSKVRLEDQRLPTAELTPADEPEAPKESTPPQLDPQPDTQGPPTLGSTNQGKGDGESTEPEGSSLPSPRNSTDTQAAATGEEKASGEQSTDASPSADSAAPETTLDAGEQTPVTTPVSTLSHRGVIPVTTVKGIFEELKERLSPEEFTELQDLILNS
ncbi:ParB/RepB/Spo0J family partition protein [Streptomyces niveus]|uniref:ParB/RepB/Spo0J family partition protein n=1 Tax=Streptomyces niveus TaxID=193462 RepID=UPI003441BC91